MIEYQGFLTKITTNDVVITANRRLSLHLERQFYQLHTANRSICPTPKILPLAQWLSESWIASSPTELLVDAQSSQFLWRSILNADRQRSALLDTVRAAELLQEAWQLMNQWKISLNSLQTESSEDVLAFVRWARFYQKRLEQEGWVDSAGLPEKLLPRLLDSSTKLPKRIFLLGFDSLSPSIQFLFDALSEKIEIIIPEEASANSQRQRIAISDRETEFRLMATWAKKLWKENPQQSIACLIPELLMDRKTLERIFLQTFENDLSRAVNISGGYSLLSYAIIEITFTSLKLISGQNLPRAEIASFLLSPFIQGEQTEIQTRALFERKLRSQTDNSLPLKIIIAWLSAENQCPQLLNQLLQTQTVFSEKPATLFPSQWAKLFSQALTLLGWPGDQALSSIEYQCANSFQQQLRRYAGLDWLFHEQNIESAIESFKALVTNTLFQAESEPDTPIQVLGILESTALPFDQVWICNMNDNNWPRPSSPNPFLPIYLQRDLSMPRSSASHESDYAKQIMHRLTQANTTIIASYSLQNLSENTELSASPLIMDFSEINSEYLGLSLPEIQCANPQTETWSDFQAPPVKADEKLRGGATILKRQAECPFWAFAEIRLKATPFEDLELGLSAAERGSLVHAVLAEIWRRLENSQALSELSESSLNNFIKEVISEILVDSQDSSVNHEQISLPTVLREIEIQRLQKILAEWLALEKTRAPFKVSAIEKPFHLKLGNLALSLQVDRIDTLEDGSEIIIDYKTGSPSPSSWFGDRPDEPQLPLYALQNPTQVQGLAFAQIRSQSIKFNGYTAQAGQLPGVKASPIEWSVVIEEWQSALSNLADQFCAGDASVAPKKYPGTCAYCHLASVCRINELELLEDE